MCLFCDKGAEENKKFQWNVRSTYADDNITEFLEEINDYDRVTDVSNFTLNLFSHKNDTYISTEYRQEIKLREGIEVISSPFTEKVQINYCPFCGKQLSENIKKLQKNNQNALMID